MVSATEERLRFGFGKNWQTFVAGVTDARIAKAQKSLQDFLGMSTLSGKTFLDIGCGSGLFSYAALKLGAERVVSFDYDANSVAATRVLYERAGQPERWHIEQGSVLDAAYLARLGQFDIVYSWGVLHHTGSMWQAIENAAKRVAPGGLFYIALYNNVGGRLGSTLWLRIKRSYNASPRFVQCIYEWLYTLRYYILPPLLRFKNPLRTMREYGAARGMHWKEDVKDWLGGYPYEYASVDEVFQFMKKNFPAFTLTNIKTTDNIGNNWFLFKYTSD